MSKAFEKIKEYYDKGLWNKARVYNMAKNNIITKTEYKKITGEEYLDMQDMNILYNDVLPFLSYCLNKHFIV